MFPFASHLLEVILPISSGFSFLPLYDTTTLDYFGVSMLEISALLKVAPHVDAVFPIHTFISINIFPSYRYLISLFSLDISSSSKLYATDAFSTSDFFIHDFQLT